MAEPEARAPGAGTRWLSVVVGPERYDVVVDEHLLVAEVLALVHPRRELVALTMSGETVPLDETVALAHLETGTMLLTAPVGADVPAPALRRPVPLDPGLGGGTETPGAEPPAAGTREALVALGTPGGSSSRRRLGYAAGSTGTATSTGTGPGVGSGLDPVAASRGERHRRGPRGVRAARTVRHGRPAALARPSATVLAASILAALALAGLVVAPPLDVRWGEGISVLLVLVGVAVAQTTSGARLVSLCAPLLGAAGGAGGTLLLGQGPVVGVLGGCAGAALVALAGRVPAGADRHVPRVWLAFSGGVGALALVALVAGLPVAVVAPVALAGVVLLARVVPDLVIDVDDDVLLDIGRLSVTSWSPREARRRRRRGWRIDDTAVSAMVAAAGVEQAAVLVGLGVVSLGASATLAVGLVRSSVPVLPTQLVLGAAVLGLTLTARAYRRRRDRTVLRTAALAPAVALAAAVLLRAGSAASVAGIAGATSAAAVVLALALVGLAMAVGRGYRSLWASRAADVLELLALVAVLPLGLWAGGLVDRAMAIFA